MDPHGPKWTLNVTVTRTPILTSVTIDDCDGFRLGWWGARTRTLIVMDSGGFGGGAPQSFDHRGALQALYQKRDQTKLAGIDGVLVKYKGMPLCYPMRLYKGTSLHLYISFNFS